MSVPLCFLFTYFAMETSLPSFSDYFKNLNSLAEIQIDLSKPLKLYLRSAELVFKQVQGKFNLES